MSLKKPSSRWLEPLVFLSLPILYFLLFGRHGFADTDQGFIPGLSHRILQGEQMYRDFNYVRPPLTPYLHAVVMWLLPHSLFMLASRAIFFLMLSASMWWGVSALDRHLDLRRLGISKWLLAALGFVFSAHNYPAMPWHTTDGIFFGSLGIYLITCREGVVMTVLGLISLYLSALAKQPFALLLPLGAGTVLFLRPTKRSLLPISVAAVACGLVTLGLIWAFPDMLRQISGASKSQDLVATGLKMYLRPLVLVVLPFAATNLMLKRWVPLRIYRQVVGWGCTMMPVAWLVMQACQVHQLGTYQGPVLWFYHFLLVFAVCLGVWKWVVVRDRGMAVHLMLCALSWVTAISWGYTVPALFSLPGVFALVYFLADDLEWLVRADGGDVTGSPRGWVMPALVGISMAFFYWVSHFPYRDAPRPELTYPAAEIFPGLSNIRTGSFGYHKLEELHQHYAAYGDPFVVLPTVPLAHFLTQSRSPLGVDWAYDIEIGQRDVPGFIDRLDASAATVFVEKHRMTEVEASTLLKHVITHWTPVDSGDYFVVYAQQGGCKPSTMMNP